ncbi:ABC transporter permease [Frankia nepalensis]|uniref:ABC transporter permease n=1 Tax=Frankia nepalensis TaxID=1836974 RepID=A0A937RIR6_9ACTN|nr:ABC transporter permease [Frankia nepalensis]MBL7495777.1 ABC transporter permease [Frankia nepalensis]MBL7513020.1 ABC transporter permease [Frankia nepalensis]MBL7627113.1 ABC transporter permease [Frankia nepalensis]
MTTTRSATDAAPGAGRALRPVRLSARDLVRVGAAGPRARPTRVALSALGIAIGIAAMISVVGVSSSSREDFHRQMAALGTNLLTVSPGQNLFGDQAHLPAEAVTMIDAIGDVESVSATGLVPDARVYRNDRIPAAASGGIAVLATGLGLPGTVGADVVAGAYLDAATQGYPAVVLGSAAAAHLGVDSSGPEQQVYLGGQWFTVVGILAPVGLAPELDRAALVGWPAAADLLGFDSYPTTVYTRAHPDRVEQTQALLARTANPAAPGEVDVSRPSDALAAQHAADSTLGALLLGLGSVALLVGGIGVANTMVISVLERRGEVGLRRALGATRGDIRDQFLAEALLLSTLGGLGGLVGGIGVTACYCVVQGWPTVVPSWAMLLALGATVLIGAVAGLYPATRASRLTPTEALTAP